MNKAFITFFAFAQIFFLIFNAWRHDVGGTVLAIFAMIYAFYGLVRAWSGGGD